MSSKETAECSLMVVKLLDLIEGAMASTDAVLLSGLKENGW